MQICKRSNSQPSFQLTINTNYLTLTWGNDCHRTRKNTYSCFSHKCYPFNFDHNHCQECLRVCDKNMVERRTWIACHRQPAASGGLRACLRIKYRVRSIKFATLLEYTEYVIVYFSWRPHLGFFNLSCFFCFNFVFNCRLVC